jgi:uncharacterized protein with PIN domain
MSDDTQGLSADVLIGKGKETVRAFTSFLGVERERYVCPECNTACEETTVHDPARAAFDGGESPAWVCPDCGESYVREVSDEGHSMDLYGRDPPQ